MLHRSSALLAAVLACPAATSQEDLPPSPRVSRYEMTARLDPQRRTILGTQHITWRNDTGAPTSELRLHLYWNAFASRDTTFMREAGPDFRAQWRDDEFGGIELTAIALVTPSGPTPLRVEFVQPEDGNRADRTVARVALPAAVAPGEQLVLETRFVAAAPKAYRRAGWIPDDGFFCMHWFPKLGVLQEVDGAAVWNCPQFHANAEFFADFSVYDVRIEVPEGYVVGATGGVPIEDALQDGQRILRFVAEDVHDFAWVADPDFVEHVAVAEQTAAADDPTGLAPRVASRIGAEAAHFDLPPVTLRLLLQPEHDTPEQVTRHLAAARCAISFFGLRYGAWPYRALTIVDPGRDVLGRRLGGGMEYPMLITCGTPDVLHPRDLRPEGVTVHEFGHQYWYGLCANDEFREAWLDEGLDTYSEGRALYLAYHDSMRPVQTTSYGMRTFAVALGATLPADPLATLGVVPLPDAVAAPAARLGIDGTWLPSSPLLGVLFEQPGLTGFREARYSDAWNDRRRWLAADNPDPMVQPGWDYLSRESYVANAYHRPATLLRTLERQTGREAWWTFLRSFHTEFRFRHPTTPEFVARLAGDVGPAAADLFERATAAGAELDYGVASVAPADGSGTVKSVVLRCHGTLHADVRVRFTFAGRAEPVWRTWSHGDRARWREFRFADDDADAPFGRLLEVWIDPPLGTPGTGESFEMPAGPAGVLMLDADLTNNAWRAESDRQPAAYRALRLLMQTQAKLTFAGVVG